MQEDHVICSRSISCKWHLRLEQWSIHSLQSYSYLPDFILFNFHFKNLQMGITIPILQLALESLRANYLQLAEISDDRGRTQLRPSQPSSPGN